MIGGTFAWIEVKLYSSCVTTSLNFEQTLMQLHSVLTGFRFHFKPFRFVAPITLATQNPHNWV